MDDLIPQEQIVPRFFWNLISMVVLDLNQVWISASMTLTDKISLQENDVRVQLFAYPLFEDGVLSGMEFVFDSASFSEGNRFSIKEGDFFYEQIEGELFENQNNYFDILEFAKRRFLDVHSGR